MTVGDECAYGYTSGLPCLPLGGLDRGLAPELSLLDLLKILVKNLGRIWIDKLEKVSWSQASLSAFLQLALRIAMPVCMLSRDW
jgi:hypothetical protein